MQILRARVHFVEIGCKNLFPLNLDVAIVQEKESDLKIYDADSDVLFETECLALSVDDYTKQRDPVMKSAEDFLSLYEAFPDKHHTVLPERKTFYGSAPRTAEEMYQHTKNVNAYYFGELGVDVDNAGNIVECRKRGFRNSKRFPIILTLACLMAAMVSYGH
ncbi:MAG: hypothetical protein ACOYH4_03080 [Saccharofermentanales bacterium]